MPILGAGLSHKTAPVEIRERLSISEKKLPEATRKLLEFPSISEGVILSTCNRTEIYVVTGDIKSGKSDVVSFLAKYHDVEENIFSDALYFYSEEETIKHLFMVASSLDSMVIGEAQILGQVKQAYNVAYQCDATSTILNRLFLSAIECGKRVRTETAIGESPVSVSYAAVQLAKNVFETLEGRAVMVVGAGEMSELTIKHLISNGANPVLVTNRTFSKARELAEEFCGVAVPYDERFEKMSGADIVISSTGAPSYVIGKPDVQKLIRSRKFRPIFMIDIAVPRDIDPEVGKLENVFLYDIDDLNHVVDEGLQERKREAERGKSLIEEDVEEFLVWLSTLDVVPAIKALNKFASDVKQVELDRAFRKLKDLNEKEREAVKALAKGVLRKILHKPIVRMKEASTKNRGYKYVEAVKYLFELDELIRKEDDSDG